MAQTPSPAWLETANRLATVATELSTVVHEVNNMLQIVSGSAEMIELRPDNRDVVVRRAQAIAAQARRASELLGDVLNFSRDSDVSLGPVDARRVAERALALRRYALGKGRIEAAVAADEGDWTVVANGRQLLQILLNGILNAEAALRGREGGVLTISLAREGDKVRVALSDNGPGYSAAPDETFREPAIEPGVPPRLGIGLRVAERLAAEQHASLSVAGEPGQGTTLSLTLRCQA